MAKRPSASGPGEQRLAGLARRAGGWAERWRVARGKKKTGRALGEGESGLGLRRGVGPGLLDWV